MSNGFISLLNIMQQTNEMRINCLPIIFAAKPISNLEHKLFIAEKIILWVYSLFPLVYSHPASIQHPALWLIVQKWKILTERLAVGFLAATLEKFLVVWILWVDPFHERLKLVPPCRLVKTLEDVKSVLDNCQDNVKIKAKCLYKKILVDRLLGILGLQFLG